MKEILTLLAILATYTGIVTYLWLKIAPEHNDREYDKGGN